jgi:hypothetical protein
VQTAFRFTPNDCEKLSVANGKRTHSPDTMFCNCGGLAGRSMSVACNRNSPQYIATDVMAMSRLRRYNVGIGRFSDLQPRRSALLFLVSNSLSASSRFLLKLFDAFGGVSLRERLVEGLPSFFA